MSAIEKYVGQSWRHGRETVRTELEKAGLWPRTDGLKLSDLKKEVEKEIARQTAVREARRARRPPICSWRKNRIVDKLASKNYTRRRVAEKIGQFENNKVRAEDLMFDGQFGTGNMFTIESRRLAFVPGGDRDVDWNYYSKRYNRPKVTVNARFIKVLRWNPAAVRCDDVVREIARLDIGSYRNSEMVKTIAEFLKIGPKRERGWSAAVQLNKYYRIAAAGKLHGIQCYVRTFAGVIQDHAARSGGVVHHAASRRDAVRGLLRKIRAETAVKNTTITRKLCKSLGFCDTGIREFCDLNGIEKNRDAATVDELRQTIAPRLRENRELFGWELQKIGVLT